MFNNKHHLQDITDGSVMSELLDTDSKPFLQHVKGEQQSVYTMSIDFANPYHNKAAGKSASMGIVAFVSLALPPSMRYKSENMFLAGVIPKDPSLDQMNPFLRPIIDVMTTVYSHGIHLTRTHKHRHGVLL